MKVIRLYCAGGMSSSMLVERMKESATKQNLDYTISAHGVNDIFCGDEHSEDCILLRPQVGFQLAKVKAERPNIPTEVIDMVA